MSTGPLAGRGALVTGVSRRVGIGYAVAEIPYPETRDYVIKVLDARGDYRREYRRELGL